MLKKIAIISTSSMVHPESNKQILTELSMNNPNIHCGMLALNNQFNAKKTQKNFSVTE
jgi:hypothetical protein